MPPSMLTEFIMLLSCSVQFSSVQSLSRDQLCDPMNCSMPGLPAHHQLPEFTQTHVHRVSDAIHHLILCCPFLLLPQIPPSIRVCRDHNKLWTILKEKRISDHLTCLLRNLYAGQEATVRTGQRTTDWFQIGKGIHQGCILSPCSCILYAENIMRNSGLDESQAGIKIFGRNINNLTYAHNTTFIAESKE